MRSLDALSADTVYPDVEASFPETVTSWSIDRAMARVLARLVIERGSRDVLEFGAGSSSIVFAKALSHVGGGRLTSVEEEPAWSAEYWSAASSTPGIDTHMIHSKVFFRAASVGLYHGYSEAARAAVAARAPFSLVLIDAPDGYFGRDGALHLALPFLAPGALIVVDDARRRKERDMMARWLAVYPGVSMLANVPTLGHGVAVLEFNGDATPRFSAGAFMSSALREAYACARNVTYEPPRPPVAALGAGQAP